MPGIDYKVSLDSSGLNNGLRSVSAVNSAFGAVSSLLRGDFVGAAMQARNAFIALKAAMLANPFVAVAAALVSVGAALAAVAWRRHQADIEALKKATEDLADATEQYNDTIKAIAFKRADNSGKLKMLQDERAKIDFDISVQRNIDTSWDPSSEPRRQAEIKRLEAELAVKDDEIREVRNRIEQEREKKVSEQATEQKRFDDKRTALVSEGDELSTQLRRGEASFKDSDLEKELISEITAMEAERDGILFDVMRKEELGVAILQKKIELQRTQNKILSEEQSAKDAAEMKMAGVKKAEAEYDFAKLTPDQQLAGIKERMKEIMGNAGWEKDAGARAEMLDLRKRRDAIEAAKKADAAKKDEDKKKPVGKSYNLLGDDQRIDLLEQARRSRSDDVIRMAGSRAGGFIDSDGVRRMAGSRAGGFSDRLRPSAFARTAAELEAKRSGMAMAAAEKTGEEQPVEIKGDAVNYLRIMADSLRKEA